LPRVEFKDLGSEILSFISSNIDISRHGSYSIQKVKVLCFEDLQFKKWLNNFNCIFKSLNPDHSFPSKTIELLFHDLLLKLIHARCNSFIKEFRELNFSRFHNSKSAGHSGLRERLKQNKGSNARSLFVEDAQPVIPLFDCIVTVTGLKHFERKLVEKEIVKYILVRQPHNVHDHNAIALVDAITHESFGFIRKEESFHLAQIMDHSILTYLTSARHGAFAECAVVFSTLDEYTVKCKVTLFSAQNRNYLTLRAFIANIQGNNIFSSLDLIDGKIFRNYKDPFSTEVEKSNNKRQKIN